MNHRSVNRRAIEQSPGQAGRSNGTIRTNAKPDLHDGSPQGFIEDFNMEHSVFSASISIRTTSGRADQREPGFRRPLRMQDLKPPSCIYLG
jgi:hypothetical protein